MRLIRRLGCVLSVALLVGCAGSTRENPVEPAAPAQDDAAITASAASRSETNRFLWGLWEVRIGADHQTAEVIPRRTAELHLNAVRLLEVLPCKDCLSIHSISACPSSDELAAFAVLRHPFPGLDEYTGFDVRGIFISAGNYTFPVSGRSTAWGDGVPQMVAADGYTALFNPIEFPETTPPALGYIPGKCATGGDLSATLNPFMAYAQDEPRRMFGAGEEHHARINLRAPEGPIHFGYAVDACWQFVEGEVTDPVNDFPPDANCLEAYQINIWVIPGLGPGAGSSAPVYIEVFDHQGLDTISTVTLEAPDLFSGEVELDFSETTGEESYMFTGTIVNELGVGYGEYPLLVRVVDTESDQNLGPVDAWQVLDLGIKRGWARTWGGPDGTHASSAAVDMDSSGNVYVGGDFKGTCDLDPGPGVQEYAGNGLTNAFLGEFSSDGEFEWACAWGGESFSDYCWLEGVALDGSGRIYVTGSFTGTVDLDPGPGVVEHWSSHQGDGYLSKFGATGELEWVRTWGADDGDMDSGARSLGVTVDGSGEVCITGHFQGTVDFDPGAATDHHISTLTDDGHNSDDVFLSKFDSSGEFQWARTWGGKSDDSGLDVAGDGSGIVYVTGGYWDTVDFDTGPGTDEHTSNGGSDVFLSKFDSSGAFQWARTWGGETANQPGHENGKGVVTYGPGDIYVTGSFSDTVDFDPGAGVDEHTSNGGFDAFVSKFNSTGEFRWARTWGGHAGLLRYDWGSDVSVGDWGNVYVTGSFHSSVDFDPGPGTDTHTACGNSRYAFLSKFESNGDFAWARTWGGVEYASASGYGVALDGSGNAYVTGAFCWTVDFDPGEGIDYQTGNIDASHAFLSKFPPNGNW